MTRSWNTPIGQITEQYNLPKTKVSRSMMAIERKLSARQEGRNWRWARKPHQSVPIPQKSRVMSTKQTTASAILSFLNIIRLYIYLYLWIPEGKP